MNHFNLLNKIFEFINYKYNNIYRQMTRSSILRIILTTSVANFKAEIVTKEGCITFSLSMSEIIPFFTLIPAFFSPFL